MRIYQIKSENRNDFTADLICEHCESVQYLNSGYHDNHYHVNVMPTITCRSCGRNRSGEVPEKSNDSGSNPVKIIEGLSNET